MFVSDLSKDANLILNDPPILYNMPIKKDEVLVYEALFEADLYDTEIDALTVQAVELICQSWLIQFHRMLSEFMPGGIYSDDNLIEPEIKKKDL